MNKNTLINLRVNKDLKEDFQAVVENEGFTMSQVLEASMKDIVKKDYVPISIKNQIDRKRKSILTIPFIKKHVDEVLASKNYKVKTVSLIGSYSKGTATPSSDVDLFLEVEEDFTLFDYAELLTELEKSLGKKVDLITKADDEFFRSRIQKEKIKIYEIIS